MKRCEDHRCVVFGSPWPGVFGTRIDSERHYARHWHATYGFGVLEHGAQRSASGRGTVEAYAGDVITTNPGEVHDGRPLGGPSRRWWIVNVDVAADSMFAGDVEITRPVIRDAGLRRVLQRLFRRIEGWSGESAEAMACEESLAEAGGLLMARYGTAPLARDAAADMRAIRERLADDP